MTESDAYRDVLTVAENRALIAAVHSAGDCSCEAVRAVVTRLLAEARAMLDDERAAKKIAADSADRFRDVLSECLGHEDENPGDDVLVAELREHFGKTGPEPTRWRDFCAGALAMVDQISAETRPIPPGEGR